MTKYENEGWSSGDFAGYQTRIVVDPYDEYCDIKSACHAMKIPMPCCGARVDYPVGAWNDCNCYDLLNMPSLDLQRYVVLAAYEQDDEQDEYATDCHYCGGSGCPSCDSDSYAP